MRLLGLYFKDNVKAWTLQPEGEYRKKERGDEKKFRVQEFLCQKAIENDALQSKRLSLELKPQKPKRSSAENMPP